MLAPGGRILGAGDTDPGSGRREDDRFGNSVRLGNQRALVGARGADAAYVLERNQGGADRWGVERKFSGPAGSLFGRSTALNGNFMAVGATNAASQIERVLWDEPGDPRFSPAPWLHLLLE